MQKNKAVLSKTPYFYPYLKFSFFVNSFSSVVRRMNSSLSLLDSALSISLRSLSRRNFFSDSRRMISAIRENSVSDEDCFLKPLSKSLSMEITPLAFFYFTTVDKKFKIFKLLFFKFTLFTSFFFFDFAVSLLIYVNAL